MNTQEWWAKPKPSFKMSGHLPFVNIPGFVNSSKSWGETLVLVSCLVDLAPRPVILLSCNLIPITTVQDLYVRFFALQTAQPTLISLQEWLCPTQDTTTSLQGCAAAPPALLYLTGWLRTSLWRFCPPVMRMLVCLMWCFYHASSALIKFSFNN